MCRDRPTDDGVRERSEGPVADRTGGPHHAHALSVHQRPDVIEHGATAGPRRPVGRRGRRWTHPDPTRSVRALDGRSRCVDGARRASAVAGRPGPPGAHGRLRARSGGAGHPNGRGPLTVRSDRPSARGARRAARRSGAGRHPGSGADRSPKLGADRDDDRGVVRRPGPVASPGSGRVAGRRSGRVAGRPAAGRVAGRWDVPLLVAARRVEGRWGRADEPHRDRSVGRSVGGRDAPSATNPWDGDPRPRHVVPRVGCGAPVPRHRGRSSAWCDPGRHAGSAPAGSSGRARSRRRLPAGSALPGPSRSRTAA